MLPSTLKTVAAAVAALWLGGLGTLALIVGPVLFVAAPSHGAAGELAARISLRFGYFGLVSAVVLLALVLAWNAVHPGRGASRVAAPAGASAAVGLAVFDVLAVRPPLERLLAVGPAHWERGQAMAFADLHRTLQWVAAGESVVLVTVLLALALRPDAARRPRPGDL